MIHVLYLALIVPLVLFHYDLLVLDPLLIRDDQLLISAVQSTNSIQEYFQKLWSGVYYDLQPIRDFSFYLNLKAREIFGYGGFHLTNLILGFGILLLVRKVLSAFIKNDLFVFLVVALIALHPVLNTSMAWVSNRKHLLSILFLMLFLKEFIKSDRTTWKSFLWILLSFLSQPITLFIPAFLIIYRKASFKIPDFAVFALTLFTLVLNVWFYSQQPQFIERNFIDSLNTEVGTYILKMARVSVQVFWPQSMAMEYDPANILSLAGIGFTIILGFLAYKYVQLKHIIVFAIFATSLFPVFKWGPRDAYLIIALIASFGMLAFYFAKLSREILIGIALVYGLFLGFQSWKFTKIWADDFTLARVSYASEGGALNMLQFAYALARQQPSKAYDIYSEFLRKYPNAVSPMLMASRASALYYSDLSDEEKLAKFRQNQEPDIFAVFFEAKLLKKLGEDTKSANAINALSRALKDESLKKLFTQIVCTLEKYQADCRQLNL